MSTSNAYFSVIAACTLNGILVGRIGCGLGWELWQIAVVSAVSGLVVGSIVLRLCRP